MDRGWTELYSIHWRLLSVSCNLVCSQLPTLLQRLLNLYCRHEDIICPGLNLGLESVSDLGVRVWS